MPVGACVLPGEMGVLVGPDEGVELLCPGGSVGDGVLFPPPLSSVGRGGGSVGSPGFGVGVRVGIVI